MKNALYIAETILAMLGAGYFFAMPAKYKPWIGAVVFGAAVVGMILTRVTE
jgi:hypothetical protein